MTVLCVPALDKKPWPTLGPQVCDFIEDCLIFGPGDLRGEPARLDDEKRALIYRAYEVFPQSDPQAGRRRFKRVAISLRKGTAKTELAAWLVAVELHPEGPVRCVGWDARGEPIGGPVNDPYIPLVAYTEEQSDELCYYALRVILSEGPLASDFDIGLSRIIRRGGDGKAVSLATAPDARDGARTSLNVFDESHRLVLPRMKEAHRTMLANVPKRKLADAWSLEITTAPMPGEGSVAEDTMDYARAVAEGRLSDSRLFFFHRQASDDHDLTTEEGVRAAAIEASGPAAEWSDMDGIVEQWRDPTADRAYLERVWLNRLVRAEDRAFDVEAWKGLANGTEPEASALITLGFDGGRYEDATAIVATDVQTGYQWPLGIWEKPLNATEWTVPDDEVDAVITDAFETRKVWRLYADPYWWESWLAEWSGRWGEKRVIGWHTNRWKQMAAAVRSYADAILAGAVSHSGDVVLTRHIGATYRRSLSIKDGEGKVMWVIQKERPDSPHKIDAAMAAVLSWEARTDAIAAGLGGGSAPVLAIGGAGEAADHPKPEFAGVRNVTL